jgi:DNA-binding MarR family transcriptional regulator
MRMQESFDPLDNLVFLSNRVARLLVNAIQKELDFDAWGVKAPHVGLLVDLWRKDGLRQQDLAISVIKDKATITRLLDHLESAALIVRLPDEQDKRSKRIFLTDQGKLMQARFWPKAEEVVRQAVGGIDPAAFEGCKEVLRTIYNQLVQEQESGFIEKK